MRGVPSPPIRHLRILLFNRGMLLSKIRLLGVIQFLCHGDQPRKLWIAHILQGRQGCRWRHDKKWAVVLRYRQLRWPPPACCQIDLPHGSVHAEHRFVVSIHDCQRGRPRQWRQRSQSRRQRLPSLGIDNANPTPRGGRVLLKNRFIRFQYLRTTVAAWILEHRLISQHALGIPRIRIPLLHDKLQLRIDRRGRRYGSASGKHTDDEHKAYGCPSGPAHLARDGGHILVFSCLCGTTCRRLNHLEYSPDHNCECKAPRF